MSIRTFAPAGFAIVPATPGDRKFMELNCHVGLWSKHLAHKISAAIVDGAGHVLSLGFNGHAGDIDDGDPRHWTKPERYAHSVHAEDNALVNASLNGVSVVGATLHVLRFPCADDDHECVPKEGCCHKIVRAGIGTVVVYSHPHDAEHPRHAGSFRQSLHHLINHGVAIRWHDPFDEMFHARMTRQPDTLPVPSGTVDWPPRFLDLACWLERWEPGGTGEVLVRRPYAGDALVTSDPRLSDRLGKIVRALGCRAGKKGGALEAARATGVGTADCTLFASRPPDRARIEEIADSGVRSVLVPLCPANRSLLADLQAEALDRGLALGLAQPRLQPAPSQSTKEPPSVIIQPDDLERLPKLDV